MILALLDYSLGMKKMRKVLCPCLKHKGKKTICRFYASIDRNVIVEIIYQ